MILPVVTGDIEAVRDFHQVGLLGDHVEACLLAAANGRLSVVQYLHRMGCDLRAGNDHAIRAAALKNHLEVLRYLHENGCDIQGCTEIAPLLSLSPDHTNIVSYLASHGVFPEGP